MELPNYSRQLMQQLQTLREEFQFCDCTILVGDVAHPAHKVVLAASSLLFKCLFETSDNISIDTAVVTSQEFSSLLDMAYLGRLLPGKHDFRRVIAAADSLQMFDIAVSCKNILDGLVKHSETARGLEDHTDVPLCEREEPSQLDASGSQLLSQGCLDSTRSPRNSLMSQNEDGAAELLSEKSDTLLKNLQDIQPWIHILRTWNTLSSQQRDMLLKCFEGDPGVDVVFQRLLDQVKDGCDVQIQAVVMFLDQIKSQKPDLESVQPEERMQTQPDLKEGSGSEVARSHINQCKLTTDLTDYLTGVENISDLLTRTADRCKSEAIKQVLLECSGEQDHEHVLRKLLSMLNERKIEETSVLQLLKETEDNSTNTADEKTDNRIGVSLLRTFQKRLCALNLEDQIIRRSLEEGPGISSDQKEILQKEADSKVEKLIKVALDGSLVQALTVWRLLFWAATHNTELQLLTEEIKMKPEAQELIHNVARLDALFKHRKLILETINEIPDLERAAGDVNHDKDITEFLQSCRGADGGTESMQQVLDRVLNRESQHIWPLCHLLSASQASFPTLSPLIEEFGQVEEHNEETAAEETADEEKEEKDEVRTYKRRRKGVVVSYSCQWCNKSFDFKCRLLKHKKHCVFCPDRVQRCTECSTMFPSVTALQQHRAKAHDCSPLKKKKAESVTCQLCAKTFKHPSGLLYHRRTEHFEERPYECEECGAKFAANSSLKNHMRLHTGEKPYHCKHCDMSFTVAAALSYHTKKKHSEGKMYSCQYCSATFAQSIELTRHVRTHTGDKPYVCRECGKGFKQANGLSMHLQTFHNISDPHDCQKCRVSFSCLDKLREHIQEVHPKELHQCPDCNKILNTAAQLEKHLSIHDVSRPYCCRSCTKSYQTLSGLWYHNRTTHPERVAAEGGRLTSYLLHCKICDKSFCNRSSLFKHNFTQHPEACAVTEEGEKDAQAEALVWRCVYCPHALSSEQELQQHMSSAHVSQQGSVFACAVCSLSFLSEAEFQQHFFTNHVQLVQEEELQAYGTTSQMVIQTHNASHEGAEQIVGIDQSQLVGSQQVFVTLGDGGETAADTEIVTLNMEDFLTGRVTLICEEKQ